MAVGDETIRLARKLRITIAAETDQATRVLVRAWVAAWDELHTTWADLSMDIAQAAAGGVWPSPSMILRERRAAEALAAANAAIGDLAAEAGVTVVDAVGRVVDATPGWESQLIASQYHPDVTRASLVGVFDRVDPRALTSVVERTTARIQSATWRLELSAQDAMRRALIHGVATGLNPKVAARLMVRRVEGAFNGGLTRALTIARTEILDAYRAAAMESQLANRDVLAGWEWYAQLDERTCPACWAMHGTVFDLTEDGPLDHQQGRCARMPITKPWAALGYPGVPEPPSVVPDATVVFDSLTPDQQLRILGPGRLAAYRAGAPLTAMATRRVTNGWRDSYVPTNAGWLMDTYITGTPT